MESIGLNQNYMRERLEQGVQLVVINSYPKCSSSTTNAMGMSSHTDHTLITILHENAQGLEILDMKDNLWKFLPQKEGALRVIVGNHLEILSNGIYKSLFHRVAQNPQNSRMPIESFHSFSMGDMVEPARKLVDKDYPKRYRASSLEKFIRHISSKQTIPYIESVKISIFVLFAICYVGFLRFF